MMRTTVTLDDELFERVREYAGPDKSASALLNDIMRLYVQREAGKRLIALGGSMPDLEPPRRRRSEPAKR